MNVTPVVAVHIPFGATTTATTGSPPRRPRRCRGWPPSRRWKRSSLQTGLSDQVSFVSLNVFGRTIGPGTTEGRQHNPNHQVSITIGKPFRGGVLGAVAPVQSDYGATAIDSKTGQGSAAGDVPASATLAAVGRTMLAAVGVSPESIAADIPSGQVLPAALA